MECHKLTVPFCKGLGYSHTSATPSQQRDNQTLRDLKQFIGNDTLCSPFFKRLVCIDMYFNPCFQQDPRGYYSICRTECEHMANVCRDKIKKLIGRSFNWSAKYCPNMGDKKGPNGLCKVTRWPQTFLWHETPTEQKPTLRSLPLSHKKIVAISVSSAVVVVVIFAVAIGVWLLKHRHPNGYRRHHKVLSGHKGPFKTFKADDLDF